jgi:phosphomannomutase/phosphomannomutase/phosphoglucomutase
VEVAMQELMRCFKAYDVRGRLPDELNPHAAERIGRACAEFLQPERVVVGRDIRHSSADLCSALADGLMAGGVDVYDIGLCGTEEIYFATFNQGFDGGIMVTASHNPIDYNGMKFVRKGSRPISGDDGLHKIRDLAIAGEFSESMYSGTRQNLDVRDSYLKHLLGYVDMPSLKPLKIVVNAGNGCAGPVVDLLEKHLPCSFVKVNHVPDGSFPNGIPNPLLPDNRSATADAVIAEKADFGIAWDGDFDRCFFFDEHGRFVEGYYIVGLLAESFLRRQPGSRIIHDPRLTWNTVDIVTRCGGVPVQSKTGHAFIKARMRAEDAIYGGEMSAHHYFKDFAYCDSGMIPWLLVYGLVSSSGKTLGQLVDERIRAFPASGEINRRVSDPAALFEKVRQQYAAQAVASDEVDGISLEMPDWRFNLRSSNTEPVVRLNVESRGDEALMQARTEELLQLIGGQP